ncbi:SOS response-associated peptidase [Sediminibacter sp. Hel_I_10]|uniref:SOS response-associated peptidase n=1 Tax=Sediminibacter sp. Hel_I_10 TaxID=1392490 RepID=UPI00047C49C9|nr:SOS response-associated peptidase [Sediminibacter sp. Hel_I_10]
MCYSISLRKEKEEIEQSMLKHFNATFDISGEYSPYYHLNGFSNGNLQIIKMDDTEKIFPASWGLVPDWAKTNPEGFRKKSNTLNARSETIFEKSSFKKSAINKRCLILADGFFEPHHENAVSIPYFCYQPSSKYPKGDLFLFAGLYNDLDSELFTATILTTEANDFFAGVHNKKKRMPLVLDENYLQDWLDTGRSEQSVNELMATGFTNNEFKAYPVSRDLYKKGIDSNQPYIIDEVQKETLF